MPAGSLQSTSLSENCLPQNRFPILDEFFLYERVDVGASMSEYKENSAKVGTVNCGNRVFGQARLMAEICYLLESEYGGSCADGCRELAASKQTSLWIITAASVQTSSKSGIWARGKVKYVYWHSMITSRCFVFCLMYLLKNTLLAFKKNIVFKAVLR